MKLVNTLIVLILSLAASVADAATGSIKYLRTDHNVMVNGVKSMRLHFKVNTHGMKGRSAKVILYFETPKGTGVPDRNGRYCTKNGKVSASDTGTATYENSVWEDFQVSIPNDEIHPLPGKHTYYIEAILFDGSKVLGRTYCSTFDMTGSAASSSDRQPSRPASQQRKSGSGSVKTWREDLGYGGFVIVKQYANGFMMRTRWRLCPNCHGSKSCASCYGTGRCAICQGQGGIISAGYGNYYPCASCGRTGRCSLCKGSGRCYCNNGEYPGYVIGSTSTIAPDGSTTRNSVDYNDRGSSSGSRSGSSSSKKTCPDCGGTRLWQRGTSPEYARPNSQLVGHYNPSGTKCRYCGYYTEHWHSKCATCKHYAGTTNPYR